MTDQRKTFLEQRRDAALADIHAQYADRRRVTDIVKPMLGDRVSNVVKLGDGDYLVEVTTPGGTVYTTVVGDKRSHCYHHSQDQALLHLIARRHDADDSGDNSDAAFYAGRVLGIPSE